MLDVHVLVMATTPKSWVDQCISSVMHESLQAPFPVEVHIMDGIPGHIGEARNKGYAMGSHPYVSYVDDDDYILPNAFVQMRDALLSESSVIFTPELTLQNGWLRSGETRHHLVAYPRSSIIDHSPYKVCGDMAQMLHASRECHPTDLPNHGYVHRLYESGGRQLRRQHLDEWRAIRGQYPA